MTINLKFVSEKEDYFKKFIIKRILKNKRKTCYITFNKSCSSVQETLVKSKGDVKRLYIVDGVTRLLKEPVDNEKCKFTKPYELEDIKRHVINFISQGCNLIIFDSLSNLLTYELMIPAGAGIIVKFINDINDELMKKGGEIIFLCKSKDRKNLLIEETEEYIKKIKK